MSSYTVSLTGTSSTLRSVLFPALRLDKNRLWEAAMLDITTYNSIPNVTENVNNKIHYYKSKDEKTGQYSQLEVFSLPTGAYEIDDINGAIQNGLGKDNITIKGNNNTMKAEIKSTFYIDFSQNHSIGSLLGFPKTTKILEPEINYTGNNTVTIMKVNSIDVTCNIIQGSYRDGENTHILHTFYPTVAPGFKIVEKPQNLVYLPLNTSFISDIVVNILDQDGNHIDFRQEPITIRIHIKSTA
jgi:hypothetical protein